MPAITVRSVTGTTPFPKGGLNSAYSEERKEENGTSFSSQIDGLYQFNLPAPLNPGYTASASRYETYGVTQKTSTYYDQYFDTTSFGGKGLIEYTTSREFDAGQATSTYVYNYTFTTTVTLWEDGPPATFTSYFRFTAGNSSVFEDAATYKSANQTTSGGFNKTSNKTYTKTTSTSSKYPYTRTGTDSTSTAVDYTSIRSSTTSPTTTNFTTKLKSEPYLYSFTTTKTEYEITVSELKSSSYKTSQLIEKQNNSETAESSWSFESYTTSKGAGNPDIGKHVLPHYSVKVAPASGPYAAQGANLYTFDGVGGDVFSECFRSVGSGTFTLIPKYFVTYVNAPIFTYSASDAGAAAGALEPVDVTFTISGMGGNVKDNGFEAFTYVNYAVEPPVTITEQLGYNEIWLETNAIKETFDGIPGIITAVTFHQRPVLSVTNTSLFTTKMQAMPQTFLTTFKSTTTVAGVAIQLEKTETSTSSSSAEAEQGTAVYYPSVGSDYVPPPGQSGRPSAQFNTYYNAQTYEFSSGKTELKADATRVWYFSRALETYSLGDGTAGMTYQIPAPAGYLGFVGTIDEPSKIKSLAAYQTYSIERIGKMFEDAVEFELSNHQDLFYLWRPSGTVIIPKVYGEFNDYTLIGTGVDALKTSAEISAIYTTTTKGSSSTSTSEKSSVTYKQITKQRNPPELSFITGTKTWSKSYSTTTSKSISISNASTETVITYKIKLQDKKTYENFASQLVEDTSGIFDNLFASTNAIISFGPGKIRGTFCDTDDGTTKTFLDFTNPKQKRLLTLPKDNVFCFESSAVYSTYWGVGQGLHYSLLNEYNFI